MAFQRMHRMGAGKTTGPYRTGSRDTSANGNRFGAMTGEMQSSAVPASSWNTARTTRPPVASTAAPNTVGPSTATVPMSTAAPNTVGPSTATIKPVTTNPTTRPPTKPVTTKPPVAAPEVTRHSIQKDTRKLMADQVAALENRH